MASLHLMGSTLPHVQGGIAYHSFGTIPRSDTVAGMCNRDRGQCRPHSFRGILYNNLSPSSGRSHKFHDPDDTYTPSSIPYCLF